jgi:hypothetical protein
LGWLLKQTVSRADLTAARDQGLSMTQLAAHLGTTRSSVARACARHDFGLRCGTGSDGHFRDDPYDLISGATDREAIDILAEVVRGLQGRAIEVPVIDGRALPARLGRLLMVLDRHRGQCVSLEAIYASMYSDALGDGPDMHSIKVSVSQLRRALEGLPVRIDCIWGRGYALHAPPGFKWPWRQ